jgi:hypothetical protein
LLPQIDETFRSQRCSDGKTLEKLRFNFGHGAKLMSSEIVLGFGFNCLIFVFLFLDGKMKNGKIKQRA